MNGGTLRRPGSGFTIVEVMIVLAVTSAMFVAAAVLISGRQNITAFNQSTRALQTQLQQIINEVGSGYYLNDGTVACAKGGPAGGPKLTAGSTEQGANVDCIFLGKVIQFAVDGTDPEEYNVYTVLGLRGSALNPSLDLSSAKARLLAKGTAAGDAAVPDVFDTKKMQYGLQVSKVYYNNNTGNAIGAVGFTSSLSSLGSADGSQQVNVLALSGTGLHAAKATAVSQINAGLATAVMNPADGVQVCVNSGSTKQSALLSIGGAGRQGVVDLRIYTNQDCT